MPTSKDVALKANVSIATVSRVYKSPELVKPATRELVLKTARELNYYPNIFARSLKEQRSNSIGISVGDFTNPFFLQVFEKLNLNIDKTNYQMMVFPPFNASLADNKTAKFLYSNQLDAFLFSPLYYNEKDHQLLTNAKQYCLQLYTDVYEDIDAVTIDDKYGTYSAFKHLLEHNHRDILMISLGLSDDPVRANGMLKAYREFGLEADMRYCQYMPSNVDPVGYIRHLIQTLKPTAIVSHTEQVTIYTLSALTDLKLSWPEDISLIAYDDHPWASLMGITAVSQPISEVADAIASTVFDALDSDQHTLQKIKIKPELISRKSVKTLPAPEQ